MKHCLAALALLAAVAAFPGDALALIVVRCVASPPGVPEDQHEGIALNFPDAQAAALAACSAAHDNIPCVLGPCVITHR
ncbi:MAG: hypothetical protein QM820_38760 [Minicystis sp.]